MIEGIELENFQSHKKSYLKFSEGVNVIVGQSDSGKTAIIRALNWIVTNKPSGESFRSYWGGKTSIRVDLKEGPKIFRIRDSKTNAYKVNDVVFQAMGQNVPEVVEKAFNFSPLNIQNQMDSPFLLASSSGEVAQVLNKVVNLDTIDKALSGINKKIYSTHQSIEFEEQRRKELEESLKEYNYLDEVERDLELLESKGLHIEESENKITYLEQDCNLFERCDSSLKLIGKIIQFEGNLKGISDLYGKLLSFQEEMEELQNCVEEIEELGDRVNLFDRISCMETRIDVMLEKGRNFFGIRQNVESFIQLIDSLETMEMKDKSLQRYLRDAIKVYEEKSPNLCPLCGQMVKKWMI